MSFQASYHSRPSAWASKANRATSSSSRRSRRRRYWTSATTVAATYAPTMLGLLLLHLHQGVVEGRPPPHVGQLLAGDRVGIAAAGAHLGPPDRQPHHQP